MRKTLKFKGIIFVLILILIILPVSISCSKQQEKTLPKTNDKIPNSLKAMVEDVNNIFNEIEKIKEEKENMIKYKKIEEKKEEEEKYRQQKDEKQDESKDKMGQLEKKTEEVKKETDMEEKIEKAWEGVNKIIVNVHKKWNDYELDVVKDGIREEDIRKFEEALDNLTISAKDKNEIKSLFNVNSVTLHISNFLNVYKGNPDGEIVKLKYNIRQIHLYGEINEWDKAIDMSKYLEPIFERLSQKIKLDKKDEKLREKLIISIRDLKSVIDKKNIELLKIKRDIALQNLDNLKEAAK
ncbi:hypothetical protein Y919_07530 [Caloranaerobacter azorensis H53214]|uniref:Lipoprotein n=1 Tax=Caloranaerobacter azorensis H53214 TaxID=1156417 RepID=A0A096CUI4_9FIRM|nr:hypothetical protein [Caloranaerobacter azorensis]KGG80199.1 hypothetical protein Y919_07530 [Caloranaerobacter azorensis H53214]